MVKCKWKECVSIYSTDIQWAFAVFRHSEDSGHDVILAFVITREHVTYMLWTLGGKFQMVKVDVIL